ncbi:MAG: NUDIX domain-containing protein [Candidatus Pacebacteria bacterium]|nr:NUDIX domain-containing protein [Candidatus Paceibacterota bacterium]
MNFLKIGLLILKEFDGEKKFLVCQKDNFTNQYIMPGGQIDKDDEIECLKEEIKEELESFLIQKS